jgi:predicted aspartyl protease
MIHLHVFLVLFFIAGDAPPAFGFQPPRGVKWSKVRSSSPLFLAPTPGIDEIRSMRVKELKAELKERNISTSDVFEKDELVKRLYEARQKSPSVPTPSPPPPQQESPPQPSKPTGNVLEGDLLFTSMETGRSIPAYNRESIQIEGVGEPYPTIQIRVEDRYDLTLLLDTACSGFVLRPSIVPKYGLKSYNVGASMTGAGGNVESAGLAQVGRFSFAGDSFGSMPAAVQDIGALPTALDGIIGLSFLQLFPCSELDVENGKVRLYKTERQPEIPPGMAVVAQGIMSRTQLGIFTVDVSLDGRGPVKMLVDTGATSSFLSWQGIADLGLSRSTVQPLTNRIGALGSDNVAMQLTHTLPVTKLVTFGQTPIGSGLVEPTDLSIDIGDIAILESQLKADKVVGILGMDLFLQCSRIRMSFTGTTPRITLLK